MKKFTSLSLFMFTVANSAFAESSGHGGAAHSSGGLPQLDISTFPSQIFWLVIVFGFLMVFFSKKTIPDISKTLENRNDRIQTDLENAEKLRKEVESVHENYESSLNNAREQATVVYKEVEQYIHNLSIKKQDELRDKADGEVANLENRISASVNAIMNEMEKIAAQVAIDATDKIIGVQVDQKDAIKVVASLSNNTVTKTTKAA